MSLEAWGDENPDNELPACGRCEENLAEHDALVADMAMLIRRLARALQKRDTAHHLVEQTKVFLLQNVEPTTTLRTTDTVLEDK